MKLNDRTTIEMIGISAFILNSVFRNSILYLCGLGDESIGNINFLAVLNIILFLMLVKKPVKDYKMVIFICVYLVLACLSNFLNNKMVGIELIMISVFPGMLIAVLNESTVKIDAVDKWLYCFNTVYIIVFSFGILDYFLGGRINVFIAQNMSSDSWSQMILSENRVNGFRMCTILGAPLMNAFYVLVFVVINRLFALYYKELLNKWFVYIFAFIVIALTGSRTAIILLMVCALVFELKAKLGVFRIAIIILLFILLINTRLFQDTIVRRLQLGFIDPNSGRYQLLLNVINGQYSKIHMFIGGGYNYSRQLTATSNTVTRNFEFPFLMFAYDYGIISTILYYLVFLVYPVIIVVKRKCYMLLFSYMILFLCLQTFNGLTNFYDLNIGLGFIVLVIKIFSYVRPQNGESITSMWKGKRNG